MTSPHIFKKGRLLEIKPLNRETNITHWFSTNEVNIKAIQHLGNNLNAVSARILLGLYKMLSFFGISKDPSQGLSKNPPNWNKFSDLLERGEYNQDINFSEQNQELLTLVEKTNTEIRTLSCKIDRLVDQDVQLLCCKVEKTNQDVQLMCCKLEKLEKTLKIILG